MKQKTADLLLVNGRFLTMEQPGDMAEAVAIEGDRILYVGTEADARAFAAEGTEIVDLEGRVAVPGLIDCHTHPTSYASRFIYLNLRGALTASLENLLAVLADAAAKTPKGEWIIGRGWDESKFAEGPIQLTAEILDRASTDHPIYICRTCGHIAVVNTMAMERSGFTDASQSPATGGHFFRDAEGHINGMISGSVLNQVPIPALTDAQREWGMIEGVQKEYFRRGVTAAGEMGSGAIPMRTLQKLDQEGKLKLRVGFYYAGRRRPGTEPMATRLKETGMLPGFGTNHVRFLGIKFVMDGSTGGRTAAFSQPYIGDPDNYGELYNDQTKLNEDVETAIRAGIQISIHAIGDRAIEGALQSIEAAEANGADLRNARIRFEHLESPTPDHIARIKRLGISVGLSSAFIWSLGDSHLNVLGYDRLVDAFPAKTLMEQGIAVGCNSDCPVCDVNPMLGIYSMVTRTTEAGRSFGGKKEAIDRVKALEAYTCRAAGLLCLEEVAGTLTAGKYADISVFDEDFLAVPDEALKDLTFYMTISGGEIVYQKTK